MQELLFATSNALKVKLARSVVESCGFTIRQTSVTVPEIQAEDGALIARDKAEKIFAQVQKPVIVSDDSWFIAGLGGFPGPYMSSMNEWFGTDDWLRLTRHLTDRRIALRQFLVYQDSLGQKTFSAEIEGILLREPRGQAPSKAMELVSFDDGKTTVAEWEDQNEILKPPTVWHQLCDWLRERQGA